MGLALAAVASANAPSEKSDFETIVICEFEIDEVLDEDKMSILR